MMNFIIMATASSLIVTAGPQFKTPTKITAAPERHHLCEMALGYTDGQQQQYDYQAGKCKTDKKTMFAVCPAVPQVWPLNFTMQFRHDAWTVACYEKDRMR